MSCACHGRPAPMAGFTEDAQLAMQSSPNYFAAWDGIKTTALIVAAAALAWHIWRYP